MSTVHVRRDEAYRRLFLDRPLAHAGAQMPASANRNPTHHFWRERLSSANSISERSREELNRRRGLLAWASSAVLRMVA